MPFKIKMTIKKIFFAAAAAVVLAFPIQASAVGGFSRACNMAEIPDSLLPSVVNLFAMIGMPSSLIDPIKDGSSTEKEKYWVLESMTADIYAGIPRYYLYSESRAYKDLQAQLWGAVQHSAIN
ncbi:hypothetical protein [Xylophilus ampelinus]|uniref:hypothetical protein n=1 Tax=Xylophilus ampelinus TaxID=54067 RepID=UPI0011B61652|nr:hypothetical protein [Xylophilus ampelinus]MCS4509952.1 hypothetical protein [Xylophilus ampelinus]